MNIFDAIIACGAQERLDVMKALEPDIEKGGSKAVLGEIRKFGGRDYIKTAEGWKFHGKGTGAKAQEHKAGTASKKEEEIPTSSDGLYQIYKVSVRNGEGGIDQYYGVPSVENKGIRGRGDGIHETLDQAIKESESNRIEEVQAIKDKEEQEVQRKKEEDEKRIKIESNKGKSKLELMNEAKNEKILDVQIRYSDGTMTRREHARKIITEGSHTEIREVDKIKELSRTAYNRMNGYQQEDHERRVKEGGKKIEYRLYQKSGSFYDVTKAEYDYAQSIEKK